MVSRTLKFTRRDKAPGGMCMLRVSESFKTAISSDFNGEDGKPGILGPPSTCSTRERTFTVNLKCCLSSVSRSPQRRNGVTQMAPLCPPKPPTSGVRTREHQGEEDRLPLGEWHHHQLPHSGAQQPRAVRMFKFRSSRQWQEWALLRAALPGLSQTALPRLGLGEANQGKTERRLDLRASFSSA